MTARRQLCITFALLVSMASLAGATSRHGTLVADDPSAREVVERHTLARSLRAVRVLGTAESTDWLLDRPRLAATLARHLHPALEQYHIVNREDGAFDVNDVGTLRGQFRLIARQGNRRAYYCSGYFRPLAQLLQLSGSMVLMLDYKSIAQDGAPAVEVTPHLYLRLENRFAHHLTSALAPLLDGIIDRRVANLAIASRAIAERIARDPDGLYHEMATWKDVDPEDLDAYRTTFADGDDE